MVSSNYKGPVRDLEKKGIITLLCLGYANRRMGNSITRGSRQQKGREVCTPSMAPSAALCEEKANTVIYSKSAFFPSEGTEGEHERLRRIQKTKTPNKYGEYWVYLVGKC